MWIGAGLQPALSSTRAITKLRGPTLVPSACSAASRLRSTFCLPRHRSGLESRSPASWRGVLARWRAGAGGWPPALQAPGHRVRCWRGGDLMASPRRRGSRPRHVYERQRVPARAPWRGRPQVRVPATGELARQQAKGAAGIPTRQQAPGAGISHGGGSRNGGLVPRRWGLAHEELIYEVQC